MVDEYLQKRAVNAGKTTDTEWKEKERLIIKAQFAAGYSAMGLAKAKISAVALANEKMEDIRNMTYDELATEHGIIYPGGNILDDETIVRKNINFNV